MAQMTISILVDTDKGQMALQGLTLDSQEAKDSAVRILLQAISLVVNLKPSVIQPAKVIPTNGHLPIKVSH